MFQQCWLVFFQSGLSRKYHEQGPCFLAFTPLLNNCKKKAIFFKFEKILKKEYLPRISCPQPVKIDLNKKSFLKQLTIQNSNIDAQGFRKTKNENPPTWEMGITS